MIIESSVCASKVMHLFFKPRWFIWNFMKHLTLWVFIILTLAYNPWAIICYLLFLFVDLRMNILKKAEKNS